MKYVQTKRDTANTAIESLSGTPESHRKQLWRVRAVNFKLTLNKLTLESAL